MSEVTDAVRVPLSPCPKCNYRLDAATLVRPGTALPKPGDFTICLRCGEVLIFGDELALRVAMANDVRAAGPEVMAEIRRVSRAVRRLDPLGRRLN